jgi:hypothetical protein
MSKGKDNSLKNILDKIDAPKTSAGFEEKILRDWERVVVVSSPAVRTHARAISLVAAHPRMSILLASFVLMAAALLSYQAWQNQDEQLNRIDVLSELSLSTL